MHQKTVIFHSDYPLGKTGLGRNAKEAILYLHKTGKYKIIFYASGMSYLHPEFSKFPFKMIGCLPNNPAEMEQINRSDEGYKRYAAYGGYYIDRVVQEEKPDVLIMSNDSWAFPYVEKPWYDKINVVAHITLDSLPFLPDQKKMIEKTKNFYVWADFAEKEAHRLGYKHVKTLTGIINPKYFKKLPSHYINELKNKYSISPDAFIVGFVFRNQLRKEVFPLIKGVAQFQKENPSKKILLYLHTHWSEGWDLHRLADDFGLDKKSILTTYVCRHCHEYDVKPFTGQDQNCRFCNTEKSLITANVGDGVTEEQLNEIYNLFNLYCHPFNAAGLEMPIVEALAAERIVATVGYSAGTTFTDKDFVFTIDHTEGMQLGTQFVRAVPSSYSICKIIDKVYNLSPEKKNELGKLGRDWMLKTFSPEVVGKQWEQIIDSLPEVNYDFKFSYEAKDDKFPMPQASDTSEFIKSLYNNILKCTPDPNGFEYWTQCLKNKMPREQIYAYFIDIARKDNEAHGIGVQTIEDFIDKTSTKPRVLVVLKESIGDAIYATGIIEGFKEQYPEYDIYVATEPPYFEVFQHLGVKLIPYHPSLESEPICTGQGDNKGYFDVYCNLAALTQKVLSYLSQPDDRLSILK